MQTLEGHDYASSLSTHTKVAFFGAGPSVEMNAGGAKLNLALTLGYTTANSRFVTPSSELSSSTGRFAFGPKVNFDVKLVGSLAVGVGINACIATGKSSFATTNFTLGPTFTF